VPCSWIEAVSGSDTWSAATAAARQGAEVIVGPEAQLLTQDASDELALHTRAAAFAQTWRCTLVLGYLRQDGPARNRALVATPDGRIQVYDKTHLVLGRESGTHGSGLPTLAPILAGQLGVMICQDDNFNDVADRYGDQACSLMAVPTNDWPAVARAHEQSGVGGRLRRAMPSFGQPRWVQASSSTLTAAVWHAVRSLTVAFWWPTSHADRCRTLPDGCVHWCPPPARWWPVCCGGVCHLRRLCPWTRAVINGGWCDGASAERSLQTDRTRCDLMSGRRHPHPS